MNTTELIILFIITILATTFFTYYIRRLLLKAKITDSPIVSEHRHKTGTPTMGGLAFLFTILLIIAIYYQNTIILITSFIMLAGGIMGLIDDLIGLKVQEVQKLAKNISNQVVSIGLLNLNPGDEARIASDKAKEELDSLVESNKLEVIAELPIKYETGELEKIIAQVLIGVFLTLTGVVTSLGGFSLGILAPVVIIIAVLGAINTVNLIDGMDGLAAGILAIASFSCMVFGFINGRMEVIPPFAILTGISIGFLVFNKYPASIFMGDTGSFILGAGFAAAVLITDIPYFGLLSLGVPIASVIISLIHRAGIIHLPVEPLHHTLNFKGISEEKIIFSYWFVTAILCIGGLVIDYFVFI